MSWSASTVALPNQVSDRVNALTPPGDSFPERDDQVKAAKAAAIALVESGALGTGEAFGITIGGHANTNHQPAAGWANDAININIYQTNAAAVDTFDQQQAAAQKNLQ